MKDSIETQKKIMYIPIVNVGVLFLCLYNCLQRRITDKQTMKLFFYVLRYALPVGLLWMCLSKALPSLEWLFGLCTMYLTPLAMSYGLIKYQENEL